MKKPIVIRKKKLKKATSKNDGFTASDARSSARKTEALLKSNRDKPTEFIEAE